MKDRQRIRGSGCRSAKGFKALCRSLRFFVIAIAISVAAHASAGAQVKLSPMGGLGGNYFEYVCGPGRVLVGLNAYAGVWIDNVQALCARVEGGSVSSQNAEGPVFGGNRPLKNSSTCYYISTADFQSTHIVAGLEADENRDKPFLGYIKLVCVDFNGSRRESSGPIRGSGLLASEPRGTGSELLVKPARQECPTGTIAVGIHGWAGQFIDSLGLICGPKPRVPEIRSLLGQEFSFQSFNYPDRYIRHRNSLGFIEPPVDNLSKKDATFKVVPGLAGRCVSFESHNYPGQFLRHQGFRVKLAPRANDQLFQEDATFCVVQGQGSGLTFESFNYPGHYIRHRNNELWVDRFDGTGLFRKDSTFQFRPPLGG